MQHACLALGPEFDSENKTTTEELRREAWCSAQGPQTIHQSSLLRKAGPKNFGHLSPPKSFRDRLGLILLLESQYLEGQRQDDQQFKDILCYIINPGQSGLYQTVKNQTNPPPAAPCLSHPPFLFILKQDLAVSETDDQLILQSKYTQNQEDPIST